MKNEIPTECINTHLNQQAKKEEEKKEAAEVQGLYMGGGGPKGLFRKVDESRSVGLLKMYIYNRHL